MIYGRRNPPARFAAPSLIGGTSPKGQGRLLRYTYVEDEGGVGEVDRFIGNVCQVKEQRRDQCPVRKYLVKSDSSSDDKTVKRPSQRRLPMQRRHVPGSAMVKYKESERCAHLIGAVLVCVMLVIAGGVCVKRREREPWATATLPQANSGTTEQPAGRGRQWRERGSRHFSLAAESEKKKDLERFQWTSQLQSSAWRQSD